MIDHIHRFTLPAMYSLLPPTMQRDQASALILAIGLQESGFAARLQMRGPARGFWQFERAGIGGIVRHPATREHVIHVLAALGYGTPTERMQRCYAAVEHNDTLACALARLLLWTLPQALPERDEVDLAWQQYVELWRPGRPRVETWSGYYAQAWTVVQPALTTAP